MSNVKRFSIGAMVVVAIVSGVCLTVGVKPASAQSTGVPGIVTCACTAHKCCCAQYNNVGIGGPNMNCQ